MTHLRPRRAALIALTAALMALGSGVAARALPPLSENGYINDRLIAAQIGDIIRKTCPEIGARMFYALSEARKLERYARKLGYSGDEIDAFISSRTEKQRVRAAADAYMAANGVVKGDVESYCALGRSEIARGSITGSLLYVK